MRDNTQYRIAYQKNNRFTGVNPPDFLSPAATAPALRIHRGMENYSPTPLVRLNAGAKKLGIKAFFIKDESRRFGLKSFKALGGVYALSRIVGEKLGLDMESLTFETLKRPEYASIVGSMTFVTATDGNHGKGVAWGAGQLGCTVEVYMPRGSSERRREAIMAVNSAARVVITDMGYDDTVRFAAGRGEEIGGYLVQDTSWPGYEKIPTEIIQGYTTMAAEAVSRMAEEGLRPTHVFLQAGVGAMAGGVAGYLANVYGDNPPKIYVAEPENMACIFRSFLIGDGEPHRADPQKDTIMAGLNCGEPCTVAWPVLRDQAAGAFACSDTVTELGMITLAHPEIGDPRIISGESGALTAGLVCAIMLREEYAPIRRELGLDENAVVLCLNTEGDTDPESYRTIVGVRK